MQFSASTIVTTLGFILGLASASIVPRSPATTGGLEFRGPSVPGGEDVKLYGSAKEIYTQLLAINPNYDNDFPTIAKAGTSDTDPPKEIDDREYKRGDQDKYPILRCDTSRHAEYSRIREGIEYLHRITGQCYLPARICSRISCSWESAIWWCSHLDITQSTDCRWLGDHAKFINNICPCHQDGDEGICYLAGIYDDTYYKDKGDLEHPVAKIHVEWDDCGGPTVKPS